MFRCSCWSQVHSNGKQLLALKIWDKSLTKPYYGTNLLCCVLFSVILSRKNLLTDILPNWEDLLKRRAKRSDPMLRFQELKKKLTQFSLKHCLVKVISNFLPALQIFNLIFSKKFSKPVECWTLSFQSSKNTFCQISRAE